MVCVFALLGLLTACSTIRPLSATRTIDGYPAKDIVVIVPEPYSFRPGLVTHTLPSGIYTPVLEDNDGIYFQSPSKLLLGDMFGPTLQDGGLVFKNGVSNDVYEYMIITTLGTGRHTKWKLPDDFKFRIEKKSSYKNFTIKASTALRAAKFEWRGQAFK